LVLQNNKFALSFASNQKKTSHSAD
jgi:hypothetical protein